jgi:hypothetical protein
MKADLQWLTMLLVVVEGKDSGGSWKGTVAIIKSLFNQVLSCNFDFKNRFNCVLAKIGCQP